MAGGSPYRPVLGAGVVLCLAGWAKPDRHLLPSERPSQSSLTKAQITLAEHQTRPAVEAMGANGPHRAARPTAARRVGELGGEEFLQETGQRVSVQPQCLFVQLILLWVRSEQIARVALRKKQ